MVRGRGGRRGEGGGEARGRGTCAVPEAPISAYQASFSAGDVTSGAGKQSRGPPRRKFALLVYVIGAGCSHPCRWTGASHSRRATRSRSYAPWQRSSSCERPRWQRCGRDHGQTRFATHAKAVHRQPLRLRTIHCRHCTALQPSFPAAAAIDRIGVRGGCGAHQFWDAERGSSWVAIVRAAS